MTEIPGPPPPWTDEQYARSLRDDRETQLTREGKTLCGACDEAIHFNHDAQLWVDAGDRHACKGTLHNHTPDP